MHCGSEEAGRQLERLQPALLAELRARGGAAAPAALALLATLCEKRPDAAEQLRQGGAVASVAQQLLHGVLVFLYEYKTKHCCCAPLTQIDTRVAASAEPLGRAGIPHAHAPFPRPCLPASPPAQAASRCRTWRPGRCGCWSGTTAGAWAPRRGCCSATHSSWAPRLWP